METRKTLNSQSNLKKEKQLGESGSQTIDYTTKLQESKQCRTGTKTDTDQWNRIKIPEIKLMLLWSINLSQRQEYRMEKRESLQ